MTTEEIEFQKEIKAVIAKYKAQFQWDYGWYSDDLSYQRITIPNGLTQFSVDDLFPERPKRGRKYI